MRWNSSKGLRDRKIWTTDSSSFLKYAHLRFRLHSRSSALGVGWSSVSSSSLCCKYKAFRGFMVQSKRGSYRRTCTERTDVSEEQCAFWWCRYKQHNQYYKQQRAVIRQPTAGGQTYCTGFLFPYGGNYMSTMLRASYPVLESLFLPGGGTPWPCFLTGWN